MISDFKTFLMRGNVVDLAVAVVIGAAFGAVVTSFVDDVLMQIISYIFGKPDFSAIHAGHIRIGAFLNAVIAFVSIAAGVFFFVVKPIQVMEARRKAQEPPAPPPGPSQEELLAEIRDLLALSGQLDG